MSIAKLVFFTMCALPSSCFKDDSLSLVTVTNIGAKVGQGCDDAKEAPAQELKPEIQVRWLPAQAKALIRQIEIQKDAFLST